MRKSSRENRGGEKKSDGGRRRRSDRLEAAGSGNACRKNKINWMERKKEEGQFLHEIGL